MRMATGSHNKLFIYDCCVGKLRVSDSDFMTIGAAPQNTFRVHMQEARGGAFAIRGNACHFYPNGQITSFSLNGKMLTSDCQISAGILHLLVLGTGCFLLWYGKEDERPDFAPMDPSNWYIYNKKSAEWTGPIAMRDMAQLKDDIDSPLLATFPGLDGQAFFLKDIQTVAEQAPETVITPGEVQSNSHSAPAPVSMEQTKAKPTTVGGRELVCPHCQHRFTEQEILAIAAHRDLRGDDILGHSAMKRFTPEKFDNRGLALDDNGALCPDTACPGCHLQLPPFFKNTHQHVIPLIGSSGSGKTYYLVSLLHQMEADLPRLFNIAFRDADTGGNAVVNRLKHQIFSARSPRQTYIGPTREGGKFYQQVWENGQFTTLPRPLIFNINSGTKSHSLVMYDYAGHESNISERQKLHMLKSPSACMFMYDPCADEAFNRLLTDNQQDESVESGHTADMSQSTVFTDTELQLRLNFNTPHGQAMQLPLAFLIGKLDMWQHLLGPEPLLPIVHGGKVISEHIQTNSRRIRQLLFNINPAICANAESLSSRVCYFALSSMGTSPMRFRDSETGEVLTAPNPADMHPTGVTAPLLWLLSCVNNAPLPAT